jgi:hypothetical protein
VPRFGSTCRAVRGPSSCVAGTAGLWKSGGRDLQVWRGCSAVAVPSLGGNPKRNGLPRGGPKAPPSRPSFRVLNGEKVNSHRHSPIGAFRCKKAKRLRNETQ